ncbi:MAG TPA: hypothetical protein PLD47_14405 [Aggregatilineales bacterium]|nr:hypothetical protein [Anaerolineales bacterium]HRE48915.1 hypothetical protein [Aggregatilineales bacterium]
MSRILEQDERQLSFSQRWASYLTILVAVGGVILGVFYKNSLVGATYPFINRQVGITARYPAQWLLTEGGAEFVLRAQDPKSLPFKTTIQVALLPTGSGARPSDILNLLDIDRARRLPGYRSLAREPFTLPNGQRSIRMEYAYASVEANPFSQAEPITVRATDIVVLRENQAVVITFLTEAAKYEANRPYFEAFLRSLSF